MRFANRGGRMQLVVAGGTIDLAQASGNRLPSDPLACLDVWDDTVRWAGGTADTDGTEPTGALLAPVPQPRQAVGIALNYRTHVGESNFTAPEEPSAFTKFPSCIAGPGSDIPIASGTVD
ncbi:MAG TPA: FAA hydrolase family protein, partial [Acidimicrobiales bacterium]|nr:FAA hydrolase family protein [Acidimicrobiales bacterium]